MADEKHNTREEHDRMAAEGARKLLTAMNLVVARIVMLDEGREKLQLARQPNAAETDETDNSWRSRPAQDDE